MRVLLFLLLPLMASAQQDFDYTVYTRHSQCPIFLNPDSSLVELLLERRIVKDGSHLTIIPCMNTGNTMEYEMEYQGNHFGKTPIHIGILSEIEMMSFEYATRDLKYNISIWPTIPLVEIHEFKSGKLYDRYY